MESESSNFTEQGVLTLAQKDWELAVKRAHVIAPLATLEIVGHDLADEAAHTLDISRRQVYELIRRYRHGAGVATELAPRKSSGGKGKGRLPDATEQIIRELIRKQYCNRQKKTVAKLYRKIKWECKTRGLRVPARNTVSLRIAKLNPMKLKRSREGQDAVRPLQSAGDTVPAITSLLEQVQIDHTIIDIIIVDERERQPIGRPYLTIAIDVYSRCIVGMVVTLEPPSSVSVGLCLAHIACDKRAWLEGLKLEVDWPMHGKPVSLYLDNAAEFKSEALKRGCEQHGIQLNYRPPGEPHYGGIVERLIGTMMEEIHELPGTTFSNPQERGDYDSEKMAVLTLAELERWLVLAVVYYHNDEHNNGQHETPSHRWAKGVSSGGKPFTVVNNKAFLVDFLPIYRRSLTRTGFVLDHIHYFSNALKPLIARRDNLPRLLIRRDSRDLSRIWMLEPFSKQYLEIPYRSLSNPAVTLWEHRQAINRLRAEGKEQIDETLLFRMIQEMRNIVHNAVKTTKKARRNQERLKHIKQSAQPASILPNIEDDLDNGSPILPYKIEEW